MLVLRDSILLFFSVRVSRYIPQYISVYYCILLYILGDLCLAVFSEDDQWYRGRVESVGEEVSNYTCAFFPSFSFPSSSSSSSSSFICLSLSLFPRALWIFGSWIMVTQSLSPWPAWWLSSQTLGNFHFRYDVQSHDYKTKSHDYHVHDYIVM